MKILLYKLFAAGLLGLVATGCMSSIEPVDPLGEARLLSSRAGDRATLRFESEEQVIYQILYASSRNGPWRILPGGQHIIGTGEDIELTDQIPLTENRHYRLRIKSLPAQ